MSRISLALVGAVLAATAAITPACANTDYSWTFTSTTLNIHGTLTTDSAPDVAGNIIGMTGLINGDTITGVVPTNSTGKTTSDPVFSFDNKLLPTGDSFVDNPGLLFITASGTEYNLYAVDFHIDAADPSNGDPVAPGGYDLDAGTAQGYGDSVNGDFSIALISSAPEPADWIMMLAGFAALGSMVRMNRKISPSTI